MSESVLLDLVSGERLALTQFPAKAADPKFGSALPFPSSKDSLEFEMPVSSRRDFLCSLGAMALLPLRQTQVQTILYNANILTMDPSNPRAQAVAIAEGRFL